MVIVKKKFRASLHSRRSSLLLLFCILSLSPTCIVRGTQGSVKIISLNRDIVIAEFPVKRYCWKIPKIIVQYWDIKSNKFVIEHQILKLQMQHPDIRIFLPKTETLRFM